MGPNNNGDGYLTLRILRPRNPEAKTAICNWCGAEYDIIRHDYKCPNCGAPKN